MQRHLTSRLKKFRSGCYFGQSSNNYEELINICYTARCVHYPNKKIMILRNLFVFLSVVFLLPVTTVHAQSVTIDNSEYRQKVLKYLASDYFITEGQGLNRAYIGQTLEQLESALGKPVKSKRQNLLSRTRINTYQLDKQTALQAGINKGIVRAVAVAGVVSSQYTTAKGARFGMPPHEIVNYYGPNTLKNNSLLYSSLGIRFDFKNGKLKIIRVFPAKK